MLCVWHPCLLQMTVASMGEGIKNERDWEELLSALTGSSEKHRAPWEYHCSKQVRNAVLRLPTLGNPAEVCDSISILLPTATP